MDNKIKEYINNQLEGLFNTLDPQRPLTISNNKMRIFERCPASYMYEYIIYPKISDSKLESMSEKGSMFHDIAEKGFDQDKTKAITHEEDEVRKVEMDKYTEYANSLPFINDECESEVALDYQINSKLTYEGIIDKIYTSRKPKFRVVDWKTSQMMTKMGSDKYQGLGYVYLVCKNNKVSPSDVMCNIVYVALEKNNEFRFSDTDLVYFENRIRTVARQIRKTEEAFIKTKSMKRIRHIRGDCTFCAASGVCLAYQSLLNPVDYIDNVDQISTTELAQEFYRFSEAESVAQSRTKVLKAALMARYEIGDEDVEKYVTVANGKKSYTLPSNEVVSYCINSAIIKTKRVEFADLIDWDEVKKTLTEELSNSLPKTISPNSIPKPIVNKLKNKMIVTSGNKYIRKDT